MTEAPETAEPLAPLEPLTWSVTPWRLFVPGAPLVAAVFAALLVYAIVLVRDLVWAVLVAVSAWVVLGDLAFVVRYRLSDRGVETERPLSGLRLLPWAQVESFRIASGGRVAALRLRASGAARWLRREQTLFLSTDATLRERIAEALEARLRRAE